MKFTRSHEGRDVREAGELWFAMTLRHRQCGRCGGLMVAEHDRDDGDVEASWGILVPTVQHCIQCGDLIDAVVLRNRFGQLMKGTVRDLKKQGDKLARGPDSIRGEHERLS